MLLTEENISNFYKKNSLRFKLSLVFFVLYCALLSSLFLSNKAHAEGSDKLKYKELIKAQDMHQYTPAVIFENEFMDRSVVNPYISVNQDSGFNKVCQYTDLDTGTPMLEVKKPYLPKTNILTGLEDPDYCPLPGRDMVPTKYSADIMGDFLFSGVICVTQSIILDSMFRVYCTILLWMFKIFLAMVAIYVTCYGLAIMFDLIDAPVRSLPFKLIKLLLLFALVTNAEVAFRYIHGGFYSILQTYSEILTELQPIYTESGEIAYRVDDNGNYILQDIDGNDWRPPKNAKLYYWLNPNAVGFYMYSGRGIYDNNFALDPTSTNLYNTTDYVEPENYRPFRIPAQQWSLEPRQKDDPNAGYIIVPVFKDTSSDLDGTPSTITSIMDFIPYKDGLALAPRYTTDGNRHLPLMTPFGKYSSGGPTDYSQIIFKPMPIIQTEYSSVSNANDAYLQQELCDPNNPDNPKQSLKKKCRQPFQGVVSRIDSMFNAIIGGDRARGFSALVVAIILWGLGGGIFISLFLSLGIVTMFTSFINMIWTYTTAIMALTFLMMLSPVFIALALFNITENIFRTWLASLISFCMQVILMLGFLYFIASIVSIEQLSSLTKTEIGAEVHTFEMNGKTISFKASGFKKPRYKWPSSSTDCVVQNGTNNYILAQLNRNESMCTSAGGVYNTNTCDLSNATVDIYCPPPTKTEQAIFISKDAANVADTRTYTEDNYAPEIIDPKTGAYVSAYMSYYGRKKYITEVQQKFFEGYKVCNYLDVFFNSDFTSDYPQGIKQCYVDWDKISNTIISETTLIVGDPALLAEYNSRLDVFNQQNKSKSKIADKLGFSRIGIDALYDFVYDLNEDITLPDTVDADYTANHGNTNIKELVDVYNMVIGVDDYDAFSGEPANIEQPQGEYPPCLLNCPNFNPPYHIDDNPNPNIDSCNKFCWFSWGSRDAKFSFLLAASVAWLILNIVAGAFVSKLPELAKRLANWQKYAGAVPSIGGGSQTAAGVASGGSVMMEGSKTFTMAERSGMYHMGGVFSAGLAGNEVGLLGKGMDQIARKFNNKQQVVYRAGVDKDGNPLTDKDGNTINVPYLEKVEQIPYYNKFKSGMGLLGSVLTNKQEQEKARTKNVKAFEAAQQAFNEISLSLPHNISTDEALYKLFEKARNKAMSVDGDASALVNEIKTEYLEELRKMEEAKKPSGD